MRARPSPIRPPAPSATRATGSATAPGEPLPGEPSPGDRRNEVAPTLRRQRERNEAILAHARRAAAAAVVAHVALGVVPMHERPVTALPADMRERFLSRLRGRLAEAFASPRQVPGADRSVEPEAGALANVANIAGTACSVCGGACCTRGSDHAFLGVESLSRVREENSAQSQAALYGAYVAHLPQEHYLDSCVYHGARGCTLPRVLRSTTCNRYNCGGLTQLLRALTVEGDAPVGAGGAVIGVSDNVTLRRLVHTDGTSVRDIAIGHV